MIRFRLPARLRPAFSLRAALALAGTAALFGISSAGAATAAARPAPPTHAHAPATARPAPSAHISAKVRAAKARRPIPADKAPITLSLTPGRSDGGSPLALQPGQTLTLTATTNYDVGPTPYYIEIYDDINNNLLAACPSGTTCTANVVQNSPTFPGAAAYVAYVAGYAYYQQPPQIAASTFSNPVEPSWLDPIHLSWGQNGLSVTGDHVPIIAPYYIQIYDLTRGQFVAVCSWYSNCSFRLPIFTATYPYQYQGCDCVSSFISSGFSDTYYAVIGQFDGNFPFDERDWSNTVIPGDSGY